MGLCQEFGTQIRNGCEHSMEANANNCSCPECGTVCSGLFEGCPDVWARGSQPVTIVAGRASAQALSSTALASPALSSEANNDRGNHRASRGRTASSSSSSPRAEALGSGPGSARDEVVDWFDGAFEGLRQELRSLSTGMTQQEAMVAELLDTRQGELRLVLVAEALPDLVSEAVRQAMGDHLAGVTDSFDTALGQFRAELKRIRKSTDITVEGLHESVAKALAGVQSALEAHTAELREAEASRARAIKAAVTRQVSPLVAALDETSARTDSAIALLGRKMDRMSAALEKATGIAPKPGPAPVGDRGNGTTRRGKAAPAPPAGESAESAELPAT